MPHMSFNYEFDKIPSDLPTEMPTCTSGQDTYRTTAGVTEMDEEELSFVKET